MAAKMQQILPPSARCPRCAGRLYWDVTVGDDDGELACLMCGWREVRPPRPNERSQRGIGKPLASLSQRWR